MEKLKSMKEMLVCAAQGQMSNLSNTDTKELGEVIDMIKDLEEAIYYCSITKAMEESKSQQPEYHYYTEKYIPMMDYNYYRDLDKEGLNRMYYPNRDSKGRFIPDQNSSRYYTERDGMYTMDLRDSREGHSPLTRKTYMEGKELHYAKEIQMKELEKYIQELGHDITEMIQDASAEEKQMLQQKISALAAKIK